MQGGLRCMGFCCCHPAAFFQAGALYLKSLLCASCLFSRNSPLLFPTRLLCFECCLRGLGFPGGFFCCQFGLLACLFLCLDGLQRSKAFFF